MKWAVDVRGMGWEEVKGKRGEEGGRKIDGKERRAKEGGNMEGKVRWKVVVVVVVVGEEEE